jgi:hypothetical protein
LIALADSEIFFAVGRPVRVEQTDNPTNEQLYETQQRYIDELLRIWETYKVRLFSV